MLDVVGGTCAAVLGAVGARAALRRARRVPPARPPRARAPRRGRRAALRAAAVRRRLRGAAHARGGRRRRGRRRGAAGAARVYADVWKVYYFLTSPAATRSSSPRSACSRSRCGARRCSATSPSDFWAGRWSLLVHGLFKRSIFRPLVARGRLDAAALLAFVVSGAFHEYAFMTPAGAQPHLGHCFAFFVLQAPITTAEKLLRRTSRRSPRGCRRRSKSWAPRSSSSRSRRSSWRRSPRRPRRAPHAAPQARHS